MKLKINYFLKIVGMRFYSCITFLVRLTIFRNKNGVFKIHVVAITVTTENHMLTKTKKMRIFKNFLGEFGKIHSFVLFKTRFKNS